jgi:hypothetical protein
MPQMPRAPSCGAAGFGDVILRDRQYLENIRLALISVSRYLRGELPDMMKLGSSCRAK